MTEPLRAPADRTGHADRSRAPARPDLRFMLTSPAGMIALGFGTGLSPLWPGTVGSLLGFPLYWALRDLDLAWQVAILCILVVAGVWICDRAGRDLGVSDHSAIVWDEVCGMALVLLGAPAGAPWLLASFFAFRLFDIVKPWPINVVDRRMQNGFGVMLDDLLAAGYAVASLAAAHAVFVALA